jgi:hypothetical protein
VDCRNFSSPFPTPPSKSYTHWWSLLIPSSLHPWRLLIYFLSPWICLFQKPHAKGVICDLLGLLMFTRPIPIIAHVVFHCSVWLYHILLWTFGEFLPQGYFDYCFNTLIHKFLCVTIHILFILLGVHLEVKSWVIREHQVFCFVLRQDLTMLPRLVLPPASTSWMLELQLHTSSPSSPMGF